VICFFGCKNESRPLQGERDSGEDGGEKVKASAQGDTPRTTDQSLPGSTAAASPYKRRTAPAVMIARGQSLSDGLRRRVGRLCPFALDSPAMIG